MSDIEPLRAYAVLDGERLEELWAELDHLRTDCERERMRLAACGVVAMSDTPESAKQARDMHPDYRSASCDDVARRVDECMRLRAERDDAVKKMEAGWLVVAESAMTPLIQECDTLRAENALLRAIGQKSIETIEWQRREKEVLRELVREAHVFGSSWSIAEEWHERAEKALEGKS